MLQFWNWLYVNFLWKTFIFSFLLLSRWVIKIKSAELAIYYNKNCSNNYCNFSLNHQFLGRQWHHTRNVFQVNKKFFSGHKKFKFYLDLSHIGTSYIGTPYIGTPYIGTPYIGTSHIGTSYIGTPYIGRKVNESLSFSRFTQSAYKLKFWSTNRFRTHLCSNFKKYLMRKYICFR